jgi:hypothetical protein
VTDQLVPQSRRSILAAALAGIGGAVAATITRPLPVKAVDPNDVEMNVTNNSTAHTILQQTTANTSAFSGFATGSGNGVAGGSTSGIGVWGISGSGSGVVGDTDSGSGVAGDSGSGAGVLGTTATTDRAGVIGTAGTITDSSLAADVDLDSGVYGYADQTFISSGVWGESTDGVGVAASGALGLIAQGFDGMYAEAIGGTALHAHTGGGVVPTPPTNAALFASVGTASQIGLEARGRIRFPHRSGRATIAKGKSSVTVTVTGVTSSNIVIAVLNSSGGGRFVRTAIPYTGKIVIYLNAAATGTTSVGWLVLG